MAATAQPFVDGLAAHTLRYQQCTGCSRAQHLARTACAWCGSTDLQWRDASGHGKVVAASVVTRAPSDSFRALVPYTLVLVELAEGSRVMGHADAGTAIGDAVAAGYFAHDGRTLLRFHAARG